MSHTDNLEMIPERGYAHGGHYACLLEGIKMTAPHSNVVTCAEAGMGSLRHECVSADCEEEQSIGAFVIENVS